ncbi:uncharacterized protein LOC117642482 [Thrips palmi]|uniref:Uncharacterized protein LOC117642482 n=1 Tax=Thrips palmi TaxID=161013 RepID=A0A6P8ZK74_THRPL|nr:uncharacterized protein LOC117642482 [Thrips palmi]
MFRRSDVSELDVYLLVAALLLTHQVSAAMRLSVPAAHDGVLGVPDGVLGVRGVRGHSRHARDLMDDDLLSPVLSMFSGGPRSRCCKQLTLCDLAATLLQAVEANKAQDVETLRKRKSQPAWHPFRSFSGRFRRAEQEHQDTDPEDSPPNPVLVNIARTYLRRLQQDEEDRRAEALRHAQATLERERAATHHHDDEEEEDEPEEPEAAPGGDGRDDPSPAIQKISLRP